MVAALRTAAWHRSCYRVVNKIEPLEQSPPCPSNYLVVGEAMIELRQSVRQRVLKGAVAAFQNYRSTVECQLRDISQTGCRLRLISPQILPNTFSLRVTADKTTAECEIMWRRGNDVGIRFVGAPRSIQRKRAPTVDLSY